MLGIPVGHLYSLKFRLWEMSSRAVTLPKEHALLLFFNGSYYKQSRLMFSHNEDGKWHDWGPWQLRCMDILAGDSDSLWFLSINRYLLASFIRDSDMIPALKRHSTEHALSWGVALRDWWSSCWDVSHFKSGNTMAHLCRAGYWVASVAWALSYME